MWSTWDDEASLLAFQNQQSFDDCRFLLKKKFVGSPVNNINYSLVTLLLYFYNIIDAHSILSSHQCQSDMQNYLFNACLCDNDNLL